MFFMNFHFLYPSINVYHWLQDFLPLGFVRKYFSIFKTHSYQWIDRSITCSAWLGKDLAMSSKSPVKSIDLTCPSLQGGIGGLLYLDPFRVTWTCFEGLSRTWSYFSGLSVTSTYFQLLGRTVACGQSPAHAQSWLKPILRIGFASSLAAG